MKKLLTLGVIVLASPVIAVIALYAVAVYRDGPITLGEQYPDGE